MSYLKANIDRAIVLTQADLRGFFHSMGFRLSYMESSKCLQATTGNLLTFAILGNNDKNQQKQNDVIHAPYFDSIFENKLKMCSDLAKHCTPDQKEAIQLIVIEIIKQMQKMRDEQLSGARPEGWIANLEKGTPWGDLVIALIEAFDVKLEEIAIPA